MMTKTEPFQFHGKAGEFFKIWIVNILLSVITLGIYSAWAKVRTKKYFYSNTTLINSSFDYLADPVKILKGRLLVLAVFAFYSFSPFIAPLLQEVLLIILLPILPWVVIKALKFNCYNTAYRNIRFYFNARYLEALWVFIGLPMLVAITFGLAFPYFIRAQKQFIINHSRYGTSNFLMSAEIGQFYAIVLNMFGLLLVSGVVATYLSVGLFYVNGEQSPFPITSDFIPLIFALLLPFYLFLFSFWYANLKNIVINSTEINHFSFNSELKTTAVFWIFLSNTFAIVFSFGLLIPWALVRTAKYRISCISLQMDDDINAFFNTKQEQAAAVGEEMGELLDLDLGL